VTPCR